MNVLNVQRNSKQKNSKKHNCLNLEIVLMKIIIFCRLAKHAKEHDTEGRKRGRSKMFKKCTICKKGFKTELEYNKHMEEGIHISKYYCKIIQNEKLCVLGRTRPNSCFTHLPS